MLCFSGDGSGSVSEDMMYSQQLCFFFFCFSVFFFFFLRFRFIGKQGTVRNGLITVLRTIRSDRGSHGSLHFSHRAVLEIKRTAKMNGSKFSRSDHTVRSRFQTLGDNKCDPIYNFFFFFLLITYIEPT